MFRVMYVDDEPALLDLGKIFLEQSGNLRVDTVSSVEDAIVKLQKEKYDGIISDYQMPGKDGLEFLKYIRSHNLDLPFILFTGRGREEIVIEALNSGADFYLQKGGEHKSQFVELEHKIKNAIDRKRIQDRLKESEQRMAGIINFLPDATFAVNLDKKVIAWNKTLEMMTGVLADAVLGTSGYATTPSVNNKKEPSLVDLVLNQDRKLEDEYPDVHRHGDKIVAETYMPGLYGGKGAHVWQVASPLYDTRGNMIGAIEAFRDITQRKEAEEELRRMNEDLHAAYEQLTAAEEELRANYEELNNSRQELQKEKERYRSVVEDQTELICRFTPDRKLTFVNDAYCRYFGLGREDCLEEQHHVEIPKDERILVHQHILSLTKDNPAGSIEHRIITPSGKVRWQHWNDRAIVDPLGNIIEYQSVGRDITRRKEAEDELQRKHEEVHAAYEQLTAVEEELRANYEELSNSEKELQRVKERYRSVVEDQTELICRFTPDRKLTFVNDAYCRYFGLSRAACLEEQHHVEIPKDERILVHQHILSLTKDNPAGSIEHRIITPSSKVRWQHWNDRAIVDPLGNIIEYQSVGRDITRQKEAEEELQRTHEDLYAAYEQLTATEEELRSNYEQLTATEEELRANYEELSNSEKELQRVKERYQSVVEDQTELICRFTPDRKLTFVNDAYCRYFGLSRAACLEEQHHVEIPKEERILVHQHILSLTKDNPAGSIEHRLITPSGKVRWQHWNDRAIVDPVGNIIEYQSVGRDITRQKEAEEELQRTHEDLYAAYEQLTATEEELRSNYEELGRNQQELYRSEERYRNIIEDQTEFICRFTPGGNLTFVNDAYCRYFQKRREDLVDHKFSPVILPEEHEMVKLHFASVSKDHPVRTIEHRIIMPDGEIRWQQWSDRAIFNTQGVVVEYQSVGRDITERKRMEGALQESNQKLNLLSSITRHDILNQLTALQGYHLLLKDTLPDNDQKRWVERAIKAGETIQSQILFTQQYQDIGLQKPRWQNLLACPNSVAKDHGFSLVSIDPCLGEIEIFADPLLKTVFYNLFENAVMHGGNTRHIHITGDNQDSSFRIVITDDGKGISQPVKEKIFQKGFGNHTGLGLFLVREVLSITGLTIKECGLPGEGARFEILVPRDMFRKISGTGSI
ncbi:PAS domain S-box protein [uncultured Methanoregula sp.]|uniref:PAS domain S-box protein n=1 Tax=uncultured Methanoregula sp. TaxID=1005933 RepID=UPI002AAB36E7|nr:PAS domain S-box protein [uncultured Methanoregula sp.]